MFKREKKEKKRRRIGHILGYAAGSLAAAAVAMVVFPELINRLAPEFSALHPAEEPDERDEFGPDPVRKER